MATEETILTKEQAEFLTFAGTHPSIAKNYYLTGGTPLAALYLHHRYSEDLDFFIEHEEVSLLAVQRAIKRAQQQFKLKNIAYKNYQGLHTFSLTYPNGAELKVDFNYYPFPRIEKGAIRFGIATDSLIDIAVNKIQTIATRTKTRDFVDIFFAVQEKKYAVSELIKTARSKFDWYIDPVQFAKQFTKVTELKDYPRMIKPLNKKELQSFFLAEAKKLGKEIFK